MAAAGVGVAVGALARGAIRYLSDRGRGRPASPASVGCLDSSAWTHQACSRSRSCARGGAAVSSSSSSSASSRGKGRFRLPEDHGSLRVPYPLNGAFDDNSIEYPRVEVFGLPASPHRIGRYLCVYYTWESGPRCIWTPEQGVCRLVEMGGRIQPFDATNPPSFSAGVCQPKVLRGRPLRPSAAAWRSAAL